VPPSWSRWRWTIAAAFALGGITTASWAARLPAIKADLNVGTGTIGLLLAGVTVGGIGGLTAAAPVMHRLGGRRGIPGARLVVAAAMALLGLALVLSSVPLTAVAFVLAGAGIGTLDALINVQASAVERAAGRTLMPWMHAGWSLGSAAGSGIGAACAALDITAQAQFFGEAVAVVVIGLGMAGGIPPGEPAGADEPASGLSRGEQLRQWLRGWLDWRLLLIGLVMLGVEVGEGSANSWLTLAVRSDHGQSAAVAALFFTAFSASEALTRMFAGPMVDRLGRVRATRLTTALGVLGIVAFIEGHSPWLVLIGALLWGIGVSMGFPLGMSAAAESGPDPAARISVVASIGYTAGLAAPPVIGTLAQSAGLLQALWVIAGLFAVAFAVSGVLRPRPYRPADPEAGQQPPDRAAA
jgi:MFS family permease